LTKLVGLVFPADPFREQPQAGAALPRVWWGRPPAIRWAGTAPTLSAASSSWH